MQYYSQTTGLVWWLDVEQSNVLRTVPFWVITQRESGSQPLHGGSVNSIKATFCEQSPSMIYSWVVSIVFSAIIFQIHLMLCIEQICDSVLWVL